MLYAYVLYFSPYSNEFVHNQLRVSTCNVHFIALYISPPDTGMRPF